MDEFLKLYNSHTDYDYSRYNITNRSMKLEYPKIKENTSYNKIVCCVNKTLSLNTKIFGHYGINSNILNNLPINILESLINNYPSFNTYINYYLINFHENKLFFEKVIQFENEKSVYLALDYVDISIDFNVYKDLVIKISKFENIKLVKKSLLKKNIECTIKRVLKKLKPDEIDEFYNSCSKNFIESISQNLYFIHILPPNLIKMDNVNKNILGVKIIEIKKENNNNFNNTTSMVSFDESKNMIQNIFDENFKMLFDSFPNIKNVLNFLKTYQFLTIDDNLIDISLMEDYIEFLKYIDIKKN